MKVRIFFYALLIFPFLRPCAAGVGETEPELVQRYDQVLLRRRENVSGEGWECTIGENLFFRKGIWSITAIMIDGRCEQISYRTPGIWTEEHFAFVFEANGGREAWVEETGAKTRYRRSWSRADGVTATWQLGVALTLTTPTYARVREEAEKQAMGRL